MYSECTQNIGYTAYTDTSIVVIRHNISCLKQRKQGVLQNLSFTKVFWVDKLATQYASVATYDLLWELSNRGAPPSGQQITPPISSFIQWDNIIEVIKIFMNVSFIKLLDPFW